MNPLKPGQIVRSKAGRDRGRYLVVLEVIDDQYVLVSDGKLRMANHPKKKKVLHLAKTNRISKEIEARLNEGRKVTNVDVRRVLDTLNIGDSDKTDIPTGD